MSKAVKQVAGVVAIAVGAYFQQGWLVAIGAGMLAQGMKTPDMGHLDQAELKQIVRSSKEPARYVFGRTGTGALLAWAQEEPGEQDEKELLHLVYVLTEGGIDGMDEIYVDQESINSPKAAELITYEIHSDANTPDPYMLANSPDWRDTQIGRGLTWVRVTLKYDPEYFAAGIPNVLFEYRGRNDIYDPRTETSSYSNNAALVILWYVRHRLHVPDEEILWDTFIDAANICDEIVTNPDGSTERRYTVSGAFKADERKDRVLADLEAACAGSLIRVGGKFGLQVGAYYGPYEIVIDEDMLIGAVTGQTEVSRANAVNTMRGKFVSPEQRWTETDYPAVSVAEWIEEDGEQIEDSLDLRFVSSPYQSQRLANIALRRKRAGGTLELPLNFRGYACRPGRVVLVNLPTLNIVGEFRVDDWDFSGEKGCKVTLTQEQPEIYDDAVGQPFDPFNFINLPTGGIGAPTGLRFVVENVGEVVQGVLLWNPVDAALHYNVVIKHDGQAVQSAQVPAGVERCEIGGLISGDYVAEVRARGRLGLSGPATINFSVNAPPMPERVITQIGNREITLIPMIAPGASLNGGHYRYYWTMTPGATQAQSELLGEGLTITHSGLAPLQTHYYYVQSVNAYGSSPFLRVEAVTTLAFDEEWQYIQEQIFAEGGIVDGIINDVNYLENAIDAANERFEAVDADIIEASERADQAQSDADKALADAQQAINDAREAFDQGEQNGENIGGVQSNLDAAQATIDSLRGQVDALEQDGATIAFVEQITNTLTELSAIQYSALSAKSAGNAAAIDIVDQVRLTEDQALAQRITQQTSRIEDNEARITDVDTTYADRTSSLASRIGELSAKLDAAPTFGSGWEPGADFDQWLVPASNTMTAVAAGAYAGIQSALITSTRENPTVTQVVNAQISEGVTTAFNGYEVVVQIAARRPGSNAAAEFALRLTAGNQNSGWERFAPTETWALYSFRWIVPEGTQLNDRIAIWGDTSGGGGGVLVDAISIRRADAQITEITAQLEEEQRARVDGDEANALATQTLRTNFQGAQATNEQRFEALSTEQEAVSTRTDALEANVGDNTSAINVLQQVSASADDIQSIYYLAQSAKTASAAAAIDVEQRVRIDENSALAERIVSVNAELGGNIANLNDRYTALVTQTQSIAERVSVTESEFASLADETVKNTASIIETQQTIATDREVQAVALLAQSAKTASGAAAIDVENTVRQTENESLATRIVELSTDYQGNKSNVRQELTSLTDAQQAFARDFTSLETEFDDNRSSVSQELTALTDAQQATALSVTELETEFDDNRASVSNALRTLTDEQGSTASDLSQLETEFYDNRATVRDELISISDDQSATAGRLSSFEAAVDDEFASVQQDVSAVYDPATGAVARAVTVVNANGRQGVLGIQVNGRNSEIIGIADQFAILNPINNQLVTAFVVADGRVIIPEALINELTITKLKASDGSLVFRNGKLQAQYIDAANLSVKEAANFSGPVQFSQIEGAGTLAGKNSVSLSEITEGSLRRGTLDRGVRVDSGQSIGYVEDRAIEGGAAKNRVDGWTRPDTTLIDGNKLATGYAFIGTLEVAGEAITAVASSHSSGGIVAVSGDGWVEVQDVWVDGNSVSAPVNITAIASYEIAWNTGDSRSQTLRARLYDQSNNQALGTDVKFDESPHTNAYASAGAIVLAFRAPSSTVSRKFTLQVRNSRSSGGTGGNYVIRNRNITGVTTKR